MGALKSYRCSKGHVMRGKNIYLRKNGQRQCYKCIVERNRQAYAAQKAAREAQKAA